MVYCLRIEDVVIFFSILTLAMTQGNQCGDLSNPQNGRVTINAERTNATYMCNRGWLLLGIQVRTCTVEGEWSGDLPTCERRCTKPRLDPSLLIGVIGTRQSFLCQGFNRELNFSVQWYLNDVVYVNGLLNGITYSISASSSRLRIINAPAELNDSQIMCSVKYSNENECNSTDSTFLLQGLLSEVTNLCATWNLSCSLDGSIFLNWTAPFTLDISQSSYDIEYRIVISYDSPIMLNQEMVVTNNFMSILPDTYPNNISCNSFNITVTPYNYAGCGNSTTIMENPLSKQSVRVEVIQSHYISRNNIQFTIKTSPTICGTEITLMIAKSDERILYNDINVISNCSDESFFRISTLNTSIDENHLYYAIYNLTNYYGLMPNNTISTFDIQNCSVNTSSLSDETILTIDFMEDSVAQGALLMFFSVNSSPVFRALDRNDSEQYILPSNTRLKKLFVYDIEKNGLLYSGMNHPASVLNDIHQISFYADAQPKNCTVSSSEYSVSLHCECPPYNGYQVILVHSSDQTGTLYTNSSKCSASATIHIKKSGIYYLTVIKIQGNRGITQSELLHIENVTFKGKDHTPSGKSSITTPPDRSEGLGFSEIIGCVVAGIVMIIIIIGISSLVILCCFICRVRKKYNLSALHNFIMEGPQEDKEATTTALDNSL